MPDATHSPTSTHEVVLSGCTPEPLMNYLKALGILRLVAEDREHGDPNARGFWRDDMFVLRSRLDKKALEAFFLNHYRPTPIVVPWSGGDFFAVDWDSNQQKYKKTPTASAIVESFLVTTSDRLRPYRNSLLSCKEAMAACGVDIMPTAAKDELKHRKKDFEKIKWDYIERLRATCPTDTLEWIDAAAVTGTEVFAPLLGSGGGSDGNTHFSDNFMQNLWDVLPDFDAQRAPKAARDDTATRGGLVGALFGAPSTFRIEKRTSSLFDSGAVGGPNATQGMNRDSMSNPWDVILGLEGTLCFAAAAVKRLASDAASAAAFPFQFSASTTTGDRLAEKEASGREVWLPMWPRPATIGEIRTLLSEGRAEAGSRPARRGVDMARSIATLGVDRGVGAFFRYAIVKGRVGGDNYNTAACLGSFAVNERPNADLLREIDPWLDSFRHACSGDNVPARFTAALRGIDAAIFDFCRYGGASHFAGILIAFGRAEREMALTPGKIGQSKTKVGPIAGLSFAWVRAAAGTGGAHESAPIDTAKLTHEFQIALSLAGLRAADGEQSKVGPLRTNLEPVSTWYNQREQRTKAKWAEKERAVVWNAADLAANLAAVLARRVMDGHRNGCEHLPLAPTHDALAASREAIAAFFRGELDDRRIEDLLWGLMLVDTGWHGSPRLDTRAALHEQAAHLSPIYCLLKLLFLPRDLVVTQSRAGTLWNLARHGERGTHRIRPEPSVLSLLRSGRAGEAAANAMRRLRASGLTPLPHRRSGGPSRDDVWREVRLTPREGQRLAAALLIPIDPVAVNVLVQRATRGDDFDERSPALDHDPSPAARAASPTPVKD